MAMDIYKGWPLDGSLNDNAQPLAGEVIIAGMAIKKDANGLLIKALGAAGEKAFFALENQADFAVVGAKKMAYIVGNAIVLTDQYIAAGITGYGQELEVSTVALEAGKLRLRTTGPLYGWHDGTVVRDGVTYLKVKLAE